MKNKKIFGIPTLALVLGLLVVGMGTAALVNHLSNTATVNVEVESPLHLEVYDASSTSWAENTDLGTTYSNSILTFSFKETNKASVDIDSDLEIMVKESGVVNVCEEITKLEFKNSKNDDWKVIAGCEEVSNNLRWVLPTTVPANSVETYNVRVTFGDVVGTYEATVQHMLQTT